MIFTHRSRSLVSCVLITLVAASQAVFAGNLDRVVAFDIRAQPLDKALLEFGREAHVQIMFASRDTFGALRVDELKGSFTARAALSQLLRGTNFTFAETGGTVEITPIGQSRSKTPSARASDPPDIPQSESTAQTQRAHEVPQPDNKPGILQEIVVTGTHITGEETISSPMMTFSRDEIDASGAGSLGEFMEQLPVNFSEASDITGAAVPAGPGDTLDNQVGGAGIDIHGLGAQSTLILVNGHRLAAGNDEGNFVDISMIPLSAIDHVDILTDSASAIYGSDAVAGVVNIVTSPHRDGSETDARYGTVTDGGRRETQVSETMGASWEGGSGVLGYEYSDETPLMAASRAFSSSAPEPFFLLPEQVSHGLYGSFTESPSSSVSISGFALYGHREMIENYVSTGVFNRVTPAVESYVAEAGLQKSFGQAGVASLSAEYSADRSLNQAVDAPATEPSETSPGANDQGTSRLESIDADYSGAIGKLGGGPIRYAVGAQVRGESLTYADFLGDAEYQPSRTIVSEYAEIGVPIIKSLQLNVADRNERYSDFGQTNNPKVGVVWRAYQGVSVSASYSTAFRAPALFDLIPMTSAIYAPLQDPTKNGPCVVGNSSQQAGCTNTLFVFGGSPDLQPEKAKTWTTTVEFHPEWLHGARGTLSFYDIRYYNRINEFEALVSPFQTLQDEGELGPTIIQRNVSATELQQVEALAGTQLFNPFDVDPSTVTTLVNGRDLNLSSTSTNGVDFNVTFPAHAGPALLTSTLSGTRIIRFRTQFSSLSPSADTLDTAYNPISLKLRLGESLDIGNITASMFVHYSGAYTNSLVIPSQPIAAWTTVDASVAYRFMLQSDAGRSGRVSVGVLNLGNRAPPYVYNPRFPIFFDGANANPLGQFVYAEVQVKL